MRPVIELMHDYKNITPPSHWGPVGSWQWWGWKELYPDPATTIEPYLQRAAGLGKPVSLSVMLMDQLGSDSTPVDVYRRIGRTAGWVCSAAGKPDITCPAWNDLAWEREYFNLIGQIASRYDGDPRLHSVWICTGIYGETIFSQSGYDLKTHYARLFTQRCIERYPQMFTKTPVFILLSTGDRALYVSRCIEHGVGVKQNGLLPDPRNAYVAGGNGQVEAMLAAKAAGIPRGYEHAYNPNAGDTYWAMLHAIWAGASVIDLPATHLDALAALTWPDGRLLWEWTLLWLDETYGAFWIARDTEYKDANSDHGYEWPYERRMVWRDGMITMVARNSSLPADLRSWVSAYGAGFIETEATFTPEMDASHVRVTAIAQSGVVMQYGGRTVASVGDGWQVLRIDAPAGGDIILSGPGWIHGVWLEPIEDEPPTEPPEEPPTEPPEKPGGCLCVICNALRRATDYICGGRS